MTSAFQFGGLISGLDTNKIIDALMAVERQPLLNMQTQQKLLQTQKAAYSDLASKLSALQSQAFSLSLASSSQGRTASSSNTSVATASATAAAAVGTINLTVTQAATKTSSTSNGAGAGAAIGASIAGGTNLTTPNVFSTPFVSGKFTLTGGTNVYQVDTTGAVTITDVLNKISTASGGKITGAVNANNTITLTSTVGNITPGAGGDTSNFLTIANLAAATPAASITSTSNVGVAQSSGAFSGNAANLATAVTAASGTLTVNGVAVSYTSSDSINSIISRINSSVSSVTASYDSSTDKVTLRAVNTGAQAITISDSNGAGGLMAGLGLSSPTQSLGLNAQYNLNDGAGARFSTSNTVTGVVPGVTFNLVAAGSATITIAADVTSTVTAVTNFVTAFNAAWSALQQDTNVDLSTNRASIFTGDSFIQQIAPHLLSAINSAANLGTQYKDLPGIGISTGAFGSAPGTTNALVLDQGKLTTALQTNPNDVTALLTAAASANGPIATLNNYLKMLSTPGQGFDALTTSATQQINDLTTSITSLQEQLDQRQQALVKQFANLEQQMALLQAQSAQMASQLGSLSGSSGH